MSDDLVVFGIYRTVPAVEEAVDNLLAMGLASEAIFVLHPRNQDTVEFARRKRTHAPRGTAEGPTARLPLDGTVGIGDPVGSRQGLAHWLFDPVAPHEGALHGALTEMGVPDEWCNKRVVHGGFLISVKCVSLEEFFRAAGVLMFTEAIDISWPKSLAKLRFSRSRAEASGGR